MHPGAREKYASLPRRLTKLLIKNASCGRHDLFFHKHALLWSWLFEEICYLIGSYLYFDILFEGKG